jgi:holdfast attachment protein HfaA
MTAIQLDGEIQVMRRPPAILASGAIGAVAGVAIVSGIVFLLSLPAHAQQASRTAQSASEFERPYGMSYGQELTPYDASTRDANGNRTIVNGLIEGGSGVAFGSANAMASASASASAFAGGYSQGTAVGNQLNVITQGTYNTVIVNAQQTNTGNQSVVLNGKLNLND